MREMRGGEGVDKRIDVLATALQAGMNIHDLVELELAYAKDRRIVLNQATVDLVLALLHAEAHEQLVANGETGEPECLVPEEAVSTAPITQW